jgi:ribosomal protein L7/L12
MVDPTLSVIALAVAVLALPLVFGGRGAATRQLERRLERVEGKLDLLLRHLDVPQPGPDQDVLALAQAGRKIEAIKRYREITGAGLKEAKDAVERMH